MQTVAVRLPDETISSLDTLGEHHAVVGPEPSRSGTLRWIIACGLAATMARLAGWQISLDGEDWRDAPIPQADPMAPAHTLSGVVALTAALALARPAGGVEEWAQPVVVRHADHGVWRVPLETIRLPDGAVGLTYGAPAYVSP